MRGIASRGTRQTTAAIAIDVPMSCGVTPSSDTTGGMKAPKIRMVKNTFDPLNNPQIVMYGLLIAGLWQGTGLVMCLMLAGLALGRIG